jgi:hypothetical protein
MEHKESSSCLLAGDAEQEKIIMMLMTIMTIMKTFDKAFTVLISYVYGDYNICIL